jgi:hypothetical protein
MGTVSFPFACGLCWDGASNRSVGCQGMGWSCLSVVNLDQHALAMHSARYGFRFMVVGAAVSSYNAQRPAAAAA